MILKSATPAPTLPEEEVTVPKLEEYVSGGVVTVRSLRLRDRLALSLTEGYGSYGRIAAMLAASIYTRDDKGNLAPLWTVDEWEAWGGLHTNEATDLWNIAYRLSDLDGEDAEKKPLGRKSALPAVSP